MCKRGENIYKRKDGRWEARLKKANGKYAYVYGKSYMEVKGKRNELINSVYSGEIQSFNVSDQLDNWLNDCYDRVKQSTYENYYYCVHHYIRPYFENTQSNTFTKQNVCHFIKKVSNDTSLSDSYRQKILSIFKVALRFILKDEDNAKPLLDVLKIPRTQTNMIRAFSVNEQRQIEEELLKCGNAKSLGILLCFYTGLRLGELGALQWKHIDLDAKTVTVVGTLTRTKNFDGKGAKTQLTVGTTKNRSSRRSIPMPDFLADIVKSFVPHIHNKEDYVLSNASLPLDPRSLQKFYKNVLIRAGVEYRKFHTVRHTFATRALEMGVDIKTLSELLGHASVINTLNIYTHSLMEQKKRAIEKMNTMHTSYMTL